MIQYAMSSLSHCHFCSFHDHSSRELGGEGEAQDGTNE